MKVYTKRDVEELFTEKVQGYLEQGYRLNPGTMGGSQGEIAKVDLRKDDEVVRVRLESHMDWDLHTDALEITEEAFESCDVQEDNSFSRDLLWNDRGTKLQETELVEVQEGDRETPAKFITVDDFKALGVGAKRRYRMTNQEPDQERRRLSSFDPKVVLNVLRKVDGLAHCKAKDIERVWNVETTDGREYKIELANHRIATVWVGANKLSASRW